MSINKLMLFATLLIFNMTTLAYASKSNSDDKTFMALANSYIDECYLPLNPALADEAGVHLYADKLEDYSPAGINQKIKRLKAFEKRIALTDASQLSEQTQGDRALLLGNIRSQLLTVQTIRPWQNNPDFYSSGISNSAFMLMERNFAPANTRLRALIAREKEMPRVLELAQKNLVNPPKIYTEIALEQLPGLINFFRDDVPKAFLDANDATLLQAFKVSNNNVVKALRSYEQWLKTDLLPHSKGDFRIGAATFRKKLRYDEMVDNSLEDLLVIGTTNLRQNQQEFARIAHAIDPKKTPREILDEMSANHPEADKLLDSFRASFAGLIQFIQAKKIITIPSDVQPQVISTPPFMRATTFASMDTPGPFETGATDAFFNVTLPEPTWDKATIEDYMKSFSYPLINSTATHETYPGHYVQFLWMQHVNDRVRKLFGANSNAEGWAHYTEQMMLDEGFGGDTNNERNLQLLRLGQLQDALLRNARFIVGIQLHTGKMTFQQGVKFFEKEGYQSHAAALMEAKRGTADPTYLYYTLGKLQILKLRSDVEAKQGASFTLQRFHDDFMRQGFPPIKIVRKALLGDDSPTL